MYTAVFYSVVLGCITGMGVSVVWGSTPYEIAAVAVAAIVSILVWYFTRKGIAMCLMLCVLAFLLGVVHTHTATQELPEVFAADIGEKSIYTGTVVRLPDERETATRLTVVVEREGFDTKILVSAPRFPKVRVGDEITVMGTPELPEPFAADGGRTFAYDRFLQKDGVYLLVQPAAVTVTGISHSPYLYFLRMLSSLRSWFATSLERAIAEPESALAAGIIVGGKQGLGKELLDAFTVAGMLQLVVLSGYNVAIVAEGILRVLSRAPKRIAATVAIVSIACFVLAAGAGSSALRAGLMACIAVYARATYRTYDAIRILVFTLCILGLVSPSALIYDPGLQFSFLATLGLLIGTPIVERGFQWIRYETLRSLLASTIAAQIGVMPLLLWQTGNLSVVSVFANVLAGPIIPTAMATSAIAAVLSGPLELLSPVLPVVAGLPAYICLWYVITLATTSAALPYANIILPAFPLWVVGVSYVFLALIVWRSGAHIITDTSLSKTVGGGVGY